MRFLTHGDKEKRTLMLIHGMANTSDLRETRDEAGRSFQGVHQLC